MKACVFTLGCKVNQYEGQAIMTALENIGYETFDKFGFADLYVLNTCSVTAEADKKSRQLAARALKFNPKARLIVVGCSSQNNPKLYLGRPQVIAASGSGGKVKAVLAALAAPVSSGKSENSGFGLPDLYEDDLKPSPTKTRGLIKIQDGCDNYCTYCIVPYLRGRSRSRPIASVLAEASQMASGCAEIVLTGVNISAFGRDRDESLLQLVEALAPLKARKRLGSLECGVIDAPLLAAMAQGNFCDHFHLSVQSGSDGVLKRMNRRYTAGEVLQKIGLIRRYFPYAGITADIIAGFTGETEDELKETLLFVERAGLLKAHVFPYSERKGTVAAAKPQLPMAERRRRAALIAAVADRTRNDFLQKNIGRQLEVYFEEETADGLAAGYTSNYIKVYAQATPETLKTVRLKQIYRQGIKGE